MYPKLKQTHSVVQVSEIIGHGSLWPPVDHVAFESDLLSRIFQVMKLKGCCSQSCILSLSDCTIASTIWPLSSGIYLKPSHRIIMKPYMHMNRSLQWVALVNDLCFPRMDYQPSGWFSLYSCTGQVL